MTGWHPERNVSGVEICTPEKDTTSIEYCLDVDMNPHLFKEGKLCIRYICLSHVLGTFNINM